ncbi:unnamed protein product, partial [Ectocarpus sp. 8 AP-2014]
GPSRGAAKASSTKAMVRRQGKAALRVCPRIRAGALRKERYGLSCGSTKGVDEKARNALASFCDGHPCGFRC